LLGAKLPDPEYAALIEELPSALKLVIQVAVPPLKLAGLPPEHVRFVEPSLNVTVPVGVPPLPDTVAVSVVVLFGDAVYDGFTVELTVVVVAGRVE
jgi:hypothetical protein